MKHILVVDDDAGVRTSITQNLSIHAMRATCVSCSQQVYRVLGCESVDVIVVDLNLGHEDGLDIVRSLAARSDVPIIIISGDRLEEADKVIGLELGAVDYIAKPFGEREFLARIKVALRSRTYMSPKTKDRRTFSFSDYSLNLKQRRLLASTGDEIKLTASEFNLLVAFLETPKDVLSREDLLSASRVHQEEVFDRSIDVLILRLRRKLEIDCSNPRLICTARGAGYYFNSEVEVSYGRIAATAVI
ncbi:MULTISPECIES: response regulator [Rhizobium]|uniref:response regulator n=1 Tax=Rhizobium TaxID=379 RepID=UPI0031451FA6